MGDIFRRETAEHPEPFTGERLTAAIDGQVQVEHYHRYLFARSLVAGADVLDVASGEGYGAALLAQVAHSVVGVEFAASTAHAAAANFPRPNLRFLCGDARALPLADASLDFVVSFETIEHFDGQDRFLQEVRRVLRPHGAFIVSTPDRDIYSPATAPANPFHVCELSYTEFATLLHSSFRHVQVMRQRAMIGSALLPDSQSTVPPLVFDRRGDSHFEGCRGLPRAPYLVAVACDAPLPPLPCSLYVDRGDLDTDRARCAALGAELRQVQAQLSALTPLLAQAEQRAQAAEARMQDSEARTQQSETRVQQAEAQTQQSEERLVALRQEFDQLRGSLRRFLPPYVSRQLRRVAGQRP